MQPCPNRAEPRDRMPSWRGGPARVSSRPQCIADYFVLEYLRGREWCRASWKGAVSRSDRDVVQRHTGRGVRVDAEGVGQRAAHAAGALDRVEHLRVVGVGDALEPVDLANHEVSR